MKSVISSTFVAAMRSNKDIWNITYPIILGLVAQNVINVTDTAFLGRVGEAELGASAIGGLFYIALFMLGFGFGIGAQILMARRNGERNFRDIGRIFDQSLYFLFALAVVLWAFIWFLSPGILRDAIASPDVYKKSVEYIDYRIFGIFFAFMNVLFRSFYISITRTLIITMGAAIMAVVNIVLDYVMIFGHAGFPEMGIAGAGLASVIAEASAALFFVIMSIRKFNLFKYRIFTFGKPDFVTIKKTLTISVFVMVQYFVSLGGWFLFFLFIEKTGERALAVSNIIRSIYMVMMIPVWGFAGAVNSLVSNTIGEGKKEEVIPLIRRTSILSLSCSAVILPFIFLFPETTLSIYTNDPELIKASVPSLYVVGFALLALSVGVTFFNGVSGTANTATGLLIEVITIAIYLTASWFLAVWYKGNVEQIWCAEFVYVFFLGGLSYLYLRTGHWKQKQI